MTEVLDRSAHADTAMAHDLETVARNKWNLLVTIAANSGCGDDSEDAVQIAFLLVWQRRHEWTGYDPVGLMVGMTRYGVLKLRPNHGNVPPIPVDFTADYEPDLTDQFASYEADPARQYEEGADARAEEYRQRVAAEALSILAPRERRIVELHYMHGMPYSAIAPELNVNRDTASYNGRMAMRKIRRHFGEPERSERPPVKSVDPEQLTEFARARTVEVVRLLQEERLSREQVCERLGLGQGSIRVYLRNARALGLMS